jgi:TPR repeat protein
LYSGDDRVVPDVAKARSYMQLACQHGDKDGCTEYDEMRSAGSRTVAMTRQVAGFRFGMTRQEAATACARSHHQLSHVQDTDACDGVAEAVGFEVRSVLLSFCENRLCDVIVSKDDSAMTDAAWQHDFDDLKDRLTHRYGPGVERTTGEQRSSAWRWYTPSGAVDSEIIVGVVRSETAASTKGLAIRYRTKASLVADTKQKLREESNL